MKYKITKEIIPTLSIELNKSESIYAQRGAMSWMSTNIDMDTSLRGGIFKSFKRYLSGESIFLTKYLCNKGTGIISLTPELPGRIIPVKLHKKEYICQKDAFMCAQETVNLDIHFRKKLGRGFFGGEGFILQKISGKGIAFVSFDGDITQIDLKKGQTLRVDTGHIAMYEPTVEYDIQRIRGARNLLFGGEGIFLATLRGPGKIWLQNLPAKKMARKLGKYFTKQRSIPLLG